MVSERSKTNVLLNGLAALALGMVGQIYLVRGLFRDASIFYALAVILIVYTLRRQPGPVASNGASAAVRRGGMGRRTKAIAAVSGLLALLSLWLFTSNTQASLAWLLYLGSLILLIVFAFQMDQGQPGTDAERPWSRLELGLLLAILLVAVFMRVYRSNQFPFGTWYDEADNGLQALRILQDPTYRPVFIGSANLPAHFFYLIAVSFRVFGITTQAIRMVSVVMGLATVAAAYLAGRELFDRRMGLVLAFLLAVARWDVNWSRIGMHGVSVPLFELLTVGFLLRALRRGRLSDFAWAGLALGLGLCFYFSFRLFPLVILLFLLHQLLAERGFLRRYWPGLVVFGVMALFAVMPVVQFAIRQPSDFLARTNQTSIFTGKTLEQGWQAVKVSAVKHLLMFNYAGDLNGRHNIPGAPMLDSASGVLMVLGLAVCLWRGRQSRSLLLLVWLGVMLAGGIFSLDFEAPQSYRAIGSLPAVYLLAVVPLDGLWREWGRVGDPRRARYLLLPLLLLLGWVGYSNYQAYFERQAKNTASWVAFSTPETLAARIMAELGERADYYVSSFYYESPTVRFIARNVNQSFRLETSDSLPLKFNPDKEAVLILDPDRQALISQAKRFYPNATVKEYTPPLGGPPVLTAIFLTPADIAGLQGLEATYYSGKDWAGQPALVRQEAMLRYDWQDGNPVPMPFSVEWRGILHVDSYGPYRFTIKSPARVELYLDEVLTAQGEGDVQSAEINLAKGNHALRLRAVGAPGHFELTWQTPNEQEALVPPWALYVSPVTNSGLLGKYFPNGNWQPPVAFTQIDSLISFYIQIIPLPRPYTVEWEGKIFIPQSGRYGFGLESRDESFLFIDGQQVTANLQPGGYQEGSVELQQGLHDIRLRFADRTSYTNIHLYWTLPGGSRQVVPSEALLPPQGNYDVSAIAAQTPSVPSVPTDKETAPAGPLQPASEVPTSLLWQVGSCGSGPQQFQSPRGVAVDHQGNIYVADTGNRRVVKVSPDGKVLFTFGRNGNEDGEFVEPVDLAVDADDKIVVLDADNGRLQRFSSDGAFQASFGTDLDTYHPRGLGVDAAGNLYVSDTGGLRLLRLSPDGKLLHQWGSDGTAIGAGQPVDAAVASDGSIYLMEAEQGSMWQLLPDGHVAKWTAATSADTIEGPHIVVGPDNLIYVTDPHLARVVVYRPNGQPIAQFGKHGDGSGQFLKPVGIAVDATGRIYVSDTEACRVQAFGPIGTK